MAKPNLAKGAARVGGELPEETRAILGATTKAGRAARAGLGGVLANAGDELRGLWQSLGTPMGAANMASGFMGRFAVPAQVGLEASRDPKALAANPEAALTGALVRSQTPVGLFEQSPGWNQVAQAGRQQLTEALTAPGELFKPGGAGRISKRSAKNLVRMLQGIRQGFYDAPVASTMSFVAPALQAATAHAPVAGIADDAGVISYHGTPRQNAKDLDVKNAVETPGAVFFTDNPDVADIFMYPREYGEVLFEEPPGSMFKADVNFSNPFVIKGDDARKFTEDSMYQSSVVNKARASGHDGIIVEGAREGVGEHTLPGTTYVSFGPSSYKILGVKHGESW
jgi:hypothetical protein